MGLLSHSQTLEDISDGIGNELRDRAEGAFAQGITPVTSAPTLAPERDASRWASALQKAEAMRDAMLGADTAWLEYAKIIDGDDLEAKGASRAVWEQATVALNHAQHTAASELAHLMLGDGWYAPSRALLLESVV